ncbi:5-(carboxyamino)imidazole ribonucleotide synthase [Reichenbachiella carrageenanivorans]|uniref:N5-carboxyaminoimidazole ribonucleotide synthase n=1 Tax=Reichenbachiella carrageenanivorans TaxID=2979869 RepID=A0ABY6D3G1_9BACT|nr:5-(carboxyamino)imidazole ribonucleotide synthase [Reichenbachiella carrageenanivorans]UXX80697.1 5-(carboxyamino)imidazole ribonucleotide synthase [Reichenbachiella carrageenanivorans]
MSFDPNVKIGVLGGGQLGRMMIQSAIDLNLDIKSMDPDPNAPCKHLATEFVNGDIKDYDQVMAFGATCDLITVEIENVSIEALEALEKQGKKVFPQPRALKIIKDKGIQKQFYLDNDIPTSPFVLTQSLEELHQHTDLLPGVHKLRTEGYDGRGVQVIRTEADISKGFDKPALIEKFVDYDKEISVIVARNADGEMNTYPVVELEYHPEANLVEFLFSPSSISEDIRIKARELAKKVISSLDMVGLLAVEMFTTKDGDVIVNECAPRTHNSGHQTIEANVTSQFEQHIRAILNLPLGDTAIKGASVMINLLGEEGYTGLAQYEGLEEALQIEGLHVHLYGKKLTKPFRKMGHVTLVGDHLEDLKTIARSVKESIKIKA